MKHPKPEAIAYMTGLSIDFGWSHDTDMINIGVDETLLTHPASIFRWNVLMAFYRISNLLTDGWVQEGRVLGMLSQREPRRVFSIDKSCEKRVWNRHVSRNYPFLCDDGTAFVWNVDGGSKTKVMNLLNVIKFRREDAIVVTIS